jgi:putative transcriptional regulator
MQDAKFEWDDDKAARNLIRHGVSFERARMAFADPCGVGEVDDREAYGEERFTLVGMVEGTLIFVAYTERGSGCALSAPDEQPNMSKTTTSKKTGKSLDPLRTMTEAEVMAAALADPDAKPLTPEDFKRMKRIPRAKIIRRALGLTQEEFAARFRIPLGTLRDWEQGAAEPDQAARAYLTVIARNPKAVADALTP